MDEEEGRGARREGRGREKAQVGQKQGGQRREGDGDGRSHRRPPTHSPHPSSFPSEPNDSGYAFDRCFWRALMKIQA